MSENICSFLTPAMCDAHVHYREATDDAIMQSLICYSYQGGADYGGPMPNTKAGLLKAKDVASYNSHARSLVPSNVEMGFLPYLMINEQTTVDDIKEAMDLGIRDGKIYPLNRTTLSQYGVARYGKLIPVIGYCGEAGFRVHMHPEHPVMDYSHREAELAFLPIMQVLLEETDAILFWEHGSTGECIVHWKRMARNFPGRFYLTICAHHLATHEDEVRGDVSATCNPSIKTWASMIALRQLVAEDHEWVLAISDTAYHPIGMKHVFNGRCSCGCLTAPFLMPLFAHALSDLLKTPPGIAIFGRFTSDNARKAYGLPAATRLIKLAQEEWTIPKTYPVGSEIGLPFWGQKKLLWQIEPE